MPKVTLSDPGRRMPRLRALACGLLALAFCGCALAPAAGAFAPRRDFVAGVLAPAGKPSVSATLEQCFTAEVQDERSATFAGEMSVIAGTSKMEMRIDVLERGGGEASYHAVSAPGLGVWRSSAPGVKVYKYLKQVTNLAGPAFYRAAVRFRWLNDKDRLIAATELHTRRCEQPGLAASSPASAPGVPSTPSPGMPLE